MVESFYLKCLMGPGSAPHDSVAFVFTELWVPAKQKRSNRSDRCHSSLGEVTPATRSLFCGEREAFPHSRAACSSELGPGGTAVARLLRHRALLRPQLLHHLQHPVARGVRRPLGRARTRHLAMRGPSAAPSLLAQGGRGTATWRTPPAERKSLAAELEVDLCARRRGIGQPTLSRRPRGAPVADGQARRARQDVRPQCTRDRAKALSRLVGSGGCRVPFDLEARVREAPRQRGGGARGPSPGLSWWPPAKSTRRPMFSCTTWCKASIARDHVSSSTTPSSLAHSAMNDESCTAACKAWQRRRSERPSRRWQAPAATSRV